ncbi:MAG: HNH endonuclease signature motif containing protein, partial [Marmoricola sp.]
HCRFPHCTRPPVMCHAHHLVHWADGGATSLTNMVLLCSHHHRLIHAAPWTIRRTTPNDLTFDPPPDRRHRTTGEDRVHSSVVWV